MRLYRTILSLALAAAAGACSPIYYSPNTHNVLIAPERGDLVAAGVANENRVELQVGYAATDAVALQVNGGLFAPDELDNGDGGSGRFLEVGAGLFAPADRRVAWEIHALLGVGSVENDFPSTVDTNPGTTGKLSADLVRYGVQPAVGFRSRYVEGALSARLLGLRYRNVEGSLVFDDEDQAAVLREEGSYLLAEPAVTIRAGLENLKLQVQAVRSFNLTNSDFRQDRSALTVGIVADLPTR